MELPIPLHKCFFKSASKDPEILTAFAHCQKRNGEEKCVRDILAGVNFTNILRAAFSYESFARSFFVQVALVIRGLFICRSKKIYQNTGIPGLSLAYSQFLIVSNLALNSHFGAIQYIIRGFKIRGVLTERIYRERGPPVLRG